MNYRSLRYQIYRNEIKQLIAAISHIGAAVALLFINVLVPVFLMLALMAVAIIAEDDTPMDERIIYQGIYMVLLFITIKVQAKAIRGSAYQYYLQDLPIGRRKQLLIDVELTLQAGNLVLLAPLGLCFFLPDIATFIDNLFFVIFSLSVLIASQLALYRNNIPLFSLVVMPLAGAFLLSPDASALWLNCLWCAVIVLELLFIDRLNIGYKSFKVAGYHQLITQFVLHRPVNWVSRLLGALALVASYDYIVGQRPDFALVGFEVGVGFAIALILGSYQFEIERFRSQYHYYLADLPMTASNQRTVEVLPLLVLLSIILACAIGWLGYSWQGSFFVALMTSITAFGVSKFGRYYFIPPLVFLLLFYGLY